MLNCQRHIYTLIASIEKSVIQDCAHCVSASRTPIFLPSSDARPEYDTGTW
jgi:hypothetical protein